MNTEIKVGEEVYALLIQRPIGMNESTVWFGRPQESLQASRMVYEKGKSFRPHRHLLNPRIIKRTQEAFIVIKGRLAVDIYTNDGDPLGTLEAGMGECVLVYRGGHGVRVLKAGIFYEIKAGSFDGVLSEEKEFN